MANLDERIRQIVREETGQELQPGGGLEARLQTLEAQMNELQSDFRQVLEAHAEGEHRPGQ